MFKPTILIDFDYTITKERELSSRPNEDMVSALLKLHEKYRIVIYSCRANPDIFNVSEALELEEYLLKYNIPFDEIYTRKPIFYAVIDDRAFNPTQMPWKTITATLLGECVALNDCKEYIPPNP